MVVIDSDVISQGEVESREQQTVRSIGRQLSIYSLTLDEFQNALNENGKSFGSMNMDEFLNSIWTAEENQNQAHTEGAGNSSTLQFPVREGNGGGMMSSSSLQRQGSFSIPEPLCRKTVDQVWSEIQKDRHHTTNGHHQVAAAAAQKQPTFGEMTLEDFLVRAGVVRAQNFGLALAAQQPPYGNGMYQNSPNFVARPTMAIGHYQSGAPAAFLGDAYSQKPSAAAAAAAASYGAGSGGFGAGQVQGMAIGSPPSPAPDGLCTSQVESENQFGIDMSGAICIGRKRIVDGPVEKVVERRQRRMIKNRESAARSRSRKQAYTVELEAELNQLREENAHLKQALADIERKRKQQCYEEAKSKAKAKAKVQTRADKAKEKLRVMRRSLSCAY